MANTDLWANDPLVIRLPMTAETRQTCFVIMPFSKTVGNHDEAYWTKHFEHFLKPLIEEIPGIEAIRSRPLRGDILNEIITQLVTAPVVVADITDGKPNVFWELGVRQSFKHGTVTIAEEGTTPPFDLGAKGTLFYSDERVKQVEFSRDFKRAIQDCLEHPERPDSHVLEAISGRGSLFEIFRKDETIRRLDALESELDRNLMLVRLAREYSTKNQNPNADPKERGMVSSQLRTSAVELLISNRYIEEREEFYQHAEECCDIGLRMNVTLDQWVHFQTSQEKWLLKNAPGSIEQLERFKKETVTVREKIRKLT